MLNKKTNKLPKRCKSFLSRLYDILNDKEYTQIIHWNKDGNGIIIVDANKLSEIVLPKYYKHNNYSSFVRQLNMYGFHKTRGILKEGEGFEHEKFSRKSTKEQIKQMMRQNKKMKLLSKYIKTNNINNNITEESNDEFSYNNENDILQFLLEKNEENIKKILDLKNEIAELKSNNINLYNQLQQIKVGQSIIFRKIIKNQNKKIIKNHEKSQNLKELFRRYLYFLKIYSPRFMLDNLDTKEVYQTEKVDSFTFGNVGIFKKETMNINNYNNIHNINNINVNMDSFFDEPPSFIKQRQDFKSFDFIIHNNNTSNENSFFNNNNKDFK